LEQSFLFFEKLTLIKTPEFCLNIEMTARTGKQVHAKIMAVCFIAVLIDFLFQKRAIAIVKILDNTGVIHGMAT